MLTYAEAVARGLHGCSIDRAVERRFMTWREAHGVNADEPAMLSFSPLRIRCSNVRGRTVLFDTETERAFECAHTATESLDSVIGDTVRLLAEFSSHPMENTASDLDDQIGMAAAAVAGSYADEDWLRAIPGNEHGPLPCWFDRMCRRVWRFIARDHETGVEWWE